MMLQKGIRDNSHKAKNTATVGLWNEALNANDHRISWPQQPCMRMDDHICAVSHNPN